MITIEDIRDKTPQERVDYFQEKLDQLIKLTDITQTPALLQTPSSLGAYIVMVDMQNPQLMQKYGLKKVEQEKVDEPPSGTPPPANPLAN